MLDHMHKSRFKKQSTRGITDAAAVRPSYAVTALKKYIMKYFLQKVIFRRFREPSLAFTSTVKWQRQA